MQNDLWLEVRACQRTTSEAKELEHETVLRIPALSEALKAVEKAGNEMGNKGNTMWDYSRKLDPKETKDIMALFAGAHERDDGRSTTRSIDYIYYGKCYAFTLFMFKI
jgi:hypothetical protein